MFYFDDTAFKNETFEKSRTKLCMKAQPVRKIWLNNYFIIE